MSAFSFNGLSRVLTLRGFAIGLAVFLVLFAAYWHGRVVGSQNPEFKMHVSWVGLNFPEGVEIQVECGKYEVKYPEALHRH